MRGWGCEGEKGLLPKCDDATVFYFLTLQIWGLKIFERLNLLNASNLRAFDFWEFKIFEDYKLKI